MTSLLSKNPASHTEAAIDDEIVVMALDTGDFFSLTGTAHAIWRLIDGNRDRGAIIAAVAAEYAVEEQAVAGDVDNFLGELEQAGFVRSAS